MALSARKTLPASVPPSIALAFRQRCQRLDQRSTEPLSDLVGAVAGVACPGGVTPYLALHARSPRVDRRLLDRAVAAGALLEVPFARGQAMLASPADAPALLGVARRWLDERLRPLREAGAIDERKLSRLCDALHGALAAGPLGPDELRARMPGALCPTLGESARKLGFPSLFSVALHVLCVRGRIVRVPKEGRLDAASCACCLAASPMAEPDRPAALASLAASFFRAHAPAPPAAFAAWADATPAETKDAAAAAGLVSIAVEGEREPWLMPPEQAFEMAQWTPPVPARLAFVPHHDPCLAAAPQVRMLLPEGRRELPLADARGRVAAGSGPARQHWLVQGGRIAGIWEYDRDSRRVRFATVDPLPTRMRRAAEDAADDLASFIASDLGAARFDADDDGEAPGTLDSVVAAWGRTPQRSS